MVVEVKEFHTNNTHMLTLRVNLYRTSFVDVNNIIKNIIHAYMNMYCVFID